MLYRCSNLTNVWWIHICASLVARAFPNAEDPSVGDRRFLITQYEPVKQCHIQSHSTTEHSHTYYALLALPEEAFSKKLVTLPHRLHVDFYVLG